ncbi:hypothetical protein BKA93DRAFT_733065 [Sparassis latifolia]
MAQAEKSNTQLTDPGGNPITSGSPKSDGKASQSSGVGVLLGKRKAVELDRGEHGGGADFVDVEGYVQFQTAPALLDALSSTLKAYYDACLSASTPPPYISFCGTYSIVADPKIPQWKRVELVSTDLRKIAKLPHSNKEYNKAMSTKNWTETFQCDCSRGRVRPPSIYIPRARSFNIPLSSSPTSIPALADQSLQSPSSSDPPTKAPLKRTQSSLSHWILSSSVKSPSTEGTGTEVVGASVQADSLPGCGGKVHISAEEDDTHPQAHLFKGQKIVVVVEHPHDAEEIPMDTEP